jgi:phosphoribosylformimino-5-aminoimidazole carboxamide ribotide isomerase
VDLEGAKTGETVNISSVEKIVKATGLTAELGGGIRSMEVVEKYLGIGVSRVILGTAALKDPAFLEKAVSKHGEKIAVGIDINGGKVAVSGWTEVSDVDFRDFCKKMENLGVQTIICTDISRDGAMQGTNRALYAELQKEFKMNIIASGGVSTLEDVEVLSGFGVYGAILGKAIYTGAIDLKDALKLARGGNL